MMGADPLRPADRGPKARLIAFALRQAPLVFAILRRSWPIPRLGTTVLATRYDDVREVFARDADFGVPYRAKLDVIMGGEPFFLCMADGPEYRADVAAMRRAVPAADIATRLAPAFLAGAEAAVAAAGDRIEVVDGLVRRVTFAVLSEYLGVTSPPGHDLRVVATRLFEFQFADPGDDPALRREVDVLAPALRAHVDALIAARRAAGAGPDDVLGRCLALQAGGEPGFTDAKIRTALVGFIVGGPPQPPMVVPQALEQLLRRPRPLAAATRAARAGDAAAVAAHVMEAMRFDPLAPALPRVALRDTAIAIGTPRERAVKAGDTVYAGIASAMRDPRRVPAPEEFDATRPSRLMMHFGHGLHECFAAAINRVVLPLMLQPLLARGIRRVPGAAGELSKRGPFAERLEVRIG